MKRLWALYLSLEGQEQALATGGWLHVRLQHAHTSGQLGFEFPQRRFEAKIRPLADKTPVYAAVARQNKGAVQHLKQWPWIRTDWRLMMLVGIEQQRIESQQGIEM